MPASESASATYHRGHWPRVYAALVACAHIRSEILAKLSDLYYNFKGDLSANQRHYIRHVGVPWTEAVRAALEQNKALPYHYLTDGLKIIEVLNNIYTSIEWRLYSRIVNGVHHGTQCVCHLCFVESESEEL